MSLDVYLTKVMPVTIFSANITHNLGRMAEAAGIYGCVWRSEENGIVYAGHLTAPLERAIEKIRSDPDHFRQFDSENGWGLYDNFLPWLESYLAACRENPDAGVWVSR